MAEQTSTGYFQNPYKFNGKSQRSEYPDASGELDEETGLYYYGARYYDPRGSLWLGVDPWLERYPVWTPYNYVVNNPIRFIDIYGLGPKDRVLSARRMKGIAYKQEVNSALRTQNTQEARKYMNCAEFVCRVMSDDQITKGVKHLAGSGLKKYLDNRNKFEHSQTPEIGDIAAWKGHVGIVTEVGENGKITLIHARGQCKLSAENSIPIPPEKYRPGSEFYGYYRPVTETPDGKLPNSILPQSNSSPTSARIDDNTIYKGGTLPTVEISDKMGDRPKSIEAKRITL